MPRWEIIDDFTGKANSSQQMREVVSSLHLMAYNRSGQIITTASSLKELEINNS